MFSCGIDDTLSDDECSNLFDKYDVGDKLGSGQFGDVHRCVRLEDGEQFAVKVIDHQSPGALSLQASSLSPLDEAEILKQLCHPSIIAVADIFESHRFLYVVMELVSGGELFKAIAEPTVPVTERDVARCGSELLQALAYLHHHLIVHRDVKAENILLENRPSELGLKGSIKLIDFGLAAQLKNVGCTANQEDWKQLDLVCGTPHYIAPEIWASGLRDVPQEWRDDYGSLYGPKVDVWAAGVVIYLALLGCYPFEGKEATELMRSSCSPDVVPSYAPTLIAGGNASPPSDEAVAFMDSLLEKDQDERPTTAEALVHEWLSPTKRTRGVPRHVAVAVRAAAFREMERVERRARNISATELRERELALAAERARDR
eukprot:TRINITY_DN74010_c0_g1_i1.p1 TRINITY_DN74010_c0_g1~~TRINITY_DN74010_c0_g1_i1.p1  ORF type:complete len:374 (+),score=57.54 TRINITY_DN74010_c0_g1_i1:123-1244(+)